MFKQSLPKYIDKVFVPPIKCQGIKTKLVPFIARSIQWNGKGKWVEPFLGSGVVLFNIAPERALVSDTNEHIIKFYNALKIGQIDEHIVKEYLENMGVKLYNGKADFYYEIREEFNNDGDPLKLLFLNRSGFNGIMRFNGSGKYNVPFGHKPERFRKAYITKIVNQVKNIRKLIRKKDWKFIVSDWKDTLAKCEPDDFVYLDPPYIGRHTDYYNGWKENDAADLAYTSSNLPCGYALSMWKENRYRSNDHLGNFWTDCVERTYDHFYHVGSKEKFRNKITESLLIKPGFESKFKSDKAFESKIDEKNKQLIIFNS
ncbi:MAG: Dam family site-specific DNA-(adenine-N6)-methyltransferase [Bacteroidales bacterium]|nr:Dam family site-specific DNA-(adenine-N6)-methyltransferase [Bacteroidales bacterium]MCF8386275.1 Dam family site-specific DNA-(adenine-N6)-methyltransferase [Bacteroidales bacterium]MCF8397528.1 Dam family site-specific DNA-(adenine-N6)-methyltransferase [Bacteroidales bacterium]